MKTFNTLKLGVVSLATVGMIAACGGGSSSKGSAAGVAAKAKPVCSVGIQVALRDFLTEETRAKLASGAHFMDDGGYSARWLLVSTPDDSWHHEVYLDEMGVVHSDLDGLEGDYQTLTLVMFGTGYPEQTYSYYESDYMIHYEEEYNIEDDLNFIYISLDNMNNLLDYDLEEIPYIASLPRYNEVYYGSVIAGFEEGSVLFPRVIDGGISAYDFNSDLDYEGEYFTSWEMKDTLLIDLAKSIRASGGSLENMTASSYQGTTYYYDSNWSTSDSYDYEGRNSLLEYLKWYDTITSYGMQRFDKLQSGTLDLHNTGVSKACFAKVIKEVPLDGDIDHGIKPVNVIDLSDNKTVDVEMVKAMLKSLREEDKGNNIIFVDVRDTSITAEQAEALIEEEDQLGDLEVLGDIRLIHEGNRAEYDSYD